MSPETLIYTLLYFMFSFCIIYPPIEFISSGVTIPALFASLLGSESEQFVLYHIKRSGLTLFIYSLLPLGFLFGLWIFNYNDEILLLWPFRNSLFFQLFMTTCFILPLLALYQIKNWSRENWKHHPIVVNISKFCNNNSDWITVASDINVEFRSFDKISIQTNAVCKIIATENWIMKVTPLTIFIVHQSDATLEVNRSDTYNTPINNSGQAQYVNIEVKSTRENVLPFTIRINALDFRDLQDRIARTINILPSVTFHKNLIDKFVETFKEVIAENPRYRTQQELENCIGCMQVHANVKLQKMCTESDQCVTCYCRPMWCADCMAKWFASRQDSQQPDTWLSSKCTCPMCRATFCLLDVCFIEEPSL